MKRLLPTLFLLALAVTQLHAQDLIIPKQGNPITAYNVEAGAKFFFYTTEPSEDSPTLKIAKDSVLMVRKVDGSVLAPSPEVSAAAPAPKNTPAQSNFPEIKEEDIHGSLIAKGNCVYIPTDGQNESEQVAQMRLKEKIQEWGYWTVVDKPEQAHFILHFIIRSRGTDCAYLIVRPRKYYRIRPLLETGGGENLGVGLYNQETDDSNPQMNIQIAEVYARNLKGMLTDPDYYKNASKLNKLAYKVIFENKRWMACLDADNKTNNMVGYRPVE